MSAETRNNQPTLYVALELSSTRWKLAMATGPTRRPRIVTVPAHDGIALDEAFLAAQRKFELPHDCAIVTCHEAGRDGFSVHRRLVEMGVASVVVDAASIEVSRRKRRAKTDRLDALRLLKKLMQYLDGDDDIWAMVRVPSEIEEDERRLHRERGTLVSQQTRLRCRIKSWLATVGLRLEVNSKLVGRLESSSTSWGSRVPTQLKRQILRAMAQLELVKAQLAEVEAEMKERLETPQSKADERAKELSAFKGVGVVSSWTLAHEFFWRDFRNRREVGSAAGLTGTPYDSGASEWEQGIDKAGNPRVRTVAVELAWNWVRWQPDSALTRWFNERYGSGAKRSRRKGIVALARKLLVALWKYLRWGVVPQGAIGSDNQPLAVAA